MGKGYLRAGYEFDFGLYDRLDILQADNRHMRAYGPPAHRRFF